MKIKNLVPSMGLNVSNFHLNLKRPIVPRRVHAQTPQRMRVSVDITRYSSENGKKTQSASVHTVDHSYSMEHRAKSEEDLSYAALDRHPIDQQRSLESD